MCNRAVLIITVHFFKSGGDGDASWWCFCGVSPFSTGNMQLNLLSTDTYSGHCLERECSRTQPKYDWAKTCIRPLFVSLFLVDFFTELVQPVQPVDGKFRSRSSVVGLGLSRLLEEPFSPFPHLSTHEEGLELNEPSSYGCRWRKCVWDAMRCSHFLHRHSPHTAPERERETSSGHAQMAM